MRVIWTSREFTSMYDQVGDADDRKGLGTHSNRKYSSTEAKRRGGDIDQVEYRGRWIGERKRGSVCATRYVDVDAPFDDAFIAGLLCDEGPIAYELKDGYEVADEWLFEHVVPNIRSRYDNDHWRCHCCGAALNQNVVWQRNSACLSTTDSLTTSLIPHPAKISIQCRRFHCTS
jgi:hypothetical protein